MTYHTEDLLRQDNVFCTPVFRSASGIITVEAEGIGSDAAAEILFFDSQGREHIFQVHPAKNGICVFSFDPVSLCIYRDAVTFEIRLRRYESITRFLLTEQEVLTAKCNERVQLIFTDETGNRKVPVLQADRKTVRSVSIVPKNVLFIGNSLLLGMNLIQYGGEHAYGMCSSSPEQDYFYHVSQAILHHSPDCSFRKIYGSPFEHADTPEKFEEWWGLENNRCSGIPVRNSLTEDLDLIILQCGDNVNTDDKLTRFAVQAPFLLEQIKERCPNARVVWVHSWYNFERTNDMILQLRDLWKFEDVDIHDLAVPAHEARSGQAYTTPEGSAIVRDTWITHPGDLGMKKIAERILRQLGL